MAEASAVDRIEAVRGFNRFYTTAIGVLDEGLLDSPWTLTEARLLFELGRRDETTASELRGELALDAGYLSRLIGKLGRAGLIEMHKSPDDGRRTLLTLSADGRAAVTDLTARSRAQTGARLAALSETHQRRLVGAMQTIEGLLGAPAPRPPAVVLRPHEPGDLGWVVSRHAALYAREYGWDGSFELMVAEVAAEFLRGYNPARERAWIAELNGRRVGSVMLVEKSKTVAKLRLLLIEPEARGLGLGRQLVGECIRFAQARGYRKITLWTNSILHAARHIYEAFGFELVDEEPHHSFGHDLIGQTWELDLRTVAAR